MSEGEVAALQRRLLALTEGGRWTLVQSNGQRRFARAAPGPPPPRGAELFLAHLPRACYEDELVPLCRKVAEIHEFRLMMDFSGSNRGYAFVCYRTVEDAQRAIQHLNGYEIRPKNRISVMKSMDNRRLYLGGIPRTLTRDQVVESLKRVEGLDDVVMYANYSDRRENRGFAFLEFESHRMASLGRRLICSSRMPDLGTELKVDWADPEPEVEDEVMKLVRVLYIRNLLLSTTAAYIQKRVEEAVGAKVDRVKKIKDYAFVHFYKRFHAEVALEKLQDAKFDGVQIEVKWSKPVDRVLYAKFKELKNSKYTDLARTLALYQRHEQELFESVSPENHSSGYLGSSSDSSESNHPKSLNSSLANSCLADDKMLAPGRLSAICKQYNWPAPSYSFATSDQEGYKYWTGILYLHIGSPLLPILTPIKPLVTAPCPTSSEAEAMAARIALSAIWNLRNSVGRSYVPPGLACARLTAPSSRPQLPPPAYSVPPPMFWSHGLARE